MSQASQCRHTGGLLKTDILNRCAVTGLRFHRRERITRLDHVTGCIRVQWDYPTHITWPRFVSFASATRHKWQNTCLWETFHTFESTAYSASTPPITSHLWYLWQRYISCNMCVSTCSPTRTLLICSDKFCACRWSWDLCVRLPNWLTEQQLFL